MRLHHLILVHPYPVIKLFCEDIIFAHPHGGALCCHKFAAYIESDNTLYLIYEKHPDIIVYLFRQDTLLYESIVGKKKGPLLFFQNFINAVRCLLWKMMKLDDFTFILWCFVILVAIIISLSKIWFPNRCLWLEHTIFKNPNTNKISWKKM